MALLEGIIRFFLFLSIIYLVIEIKSDFAKLKTNQKIAIVLIIIVGSLVLIPNLIDFFNGFYKGFIEDQKF